MKLFVSALLLALGAVAALRADGPVVINELHHSPDPKQQRVEFIELFNRGPAVLDLAGWRLSGGVKFTFPTNTPFAPGTYLLRFNCCF